jgi:hypothetical protein
MNLFVGGMALMGGCSSTSASVHPTQHTDIRTPFRFGNGADGGVQQHSASVHPTPWGSEGDWQEKERDIQRKRQRQRARSCDSGRRSRRSRRRFIDKTAMRL